MGSALINTRLIETGTRRSRAIVEGNAIKALGPVKKVTLNGFACGTEVK